jgi:asparagine synthase (glutamine-hydrolysing)
MVNSLRHRGPDDEGTYVEGGVGLGHNRLSIIDLSPRGHQPMFDETRTSCIVFNGEIYNFRSLRQQLASLGVRFRTESDTEVILAAYRHYGVECVAQMSGMFAFAIWDSVKRTLFLARDRLGKKPLFFHASNDRFAFSSEPKALLQLRWIQRDLDPAAVREFLMLQYVPGPMSIYRSIRRLLPGHHLLVHVAEDRLMYEESEYWRAPVTLVDTRANEADIIQKVHQLLEESVGLRLVSDVEVGVLLSGGLDSSLVVALATALAGKPLKTFSVSFKGSTLDESMFAAGVARQLGTQHHELEANDVTSELFVGIIDHLDEPFADPACIPTYMVASLASRYVKVVLSGEGADEVFGGYSYYAWERILGPVFKLPLSVRRRLARMMSGLVSPLFGKSVASRIDSVFASERYRSSTRWTSVFNESDLSVVLSKEWLTAVGCANGPSRLQRLYEKIEAMAAVDKAMMMDLGLWLPDDLLVKMDMMSMAHSLEARTPYLDHNLVEYVTGLEGKMKMKGFRSKRILKEVARRYLPDRVVERRKHGFEVPILTWMQGPLRELCEESFSREQLKKAEIFNVDAVQRLWVSGLNNPRAINPRRLWSIFILTQWLQRHQTRHN